MDLNAQILVDELQGSLRFSRIVTDYRTCELAYVSFYQAGRDKVPSPEEILIVAAEALDDIPPCEQATFLVWGKDDETVPAHLESCNVLVFDEGIDERGVLELVERIFVKYSHWIKEMRDIVDRNGSLSELLEASAEVTGANMMIHDKQFHVIAYFMQDYDQSFNDFYSLREGDFFSRKQLNLVNDTFRKTYGNTDPYSIKEPHFCDWVTLPRDLSYNIFLSDGYVVRINFGSADGVTGIPDRCYCLIKMLAYYVKLSYMLYPARTAAPRQGLMSSCLGKLVSGQHVKRAELEKATSERNWHYQKDEYCTFLIMPLDDSNNNLSLSSQSSYSIINRILTMISDSVSLSVGDEILVLWNQTRGRLDSDTLVRKLGELAEENKLLVVKAHAFAGLRHVKAGYDESRTVLQHLFSSHYEPGCYHIDDVSLGFMLACLEEKINPASMIPGKLARLVEYDKAKKSFLYPTLRAYVECDCSAASAAKRLYIERTALYYRLNKALDMLDMDLKDPDVQLQLRMSFKILDHLEGKR